MLIALAVPVPGPGVDSAVLGVPVTALWLWRGWGVGNLRRGRVVELMTERRKDRRRVWGVKGSSSSGAGAWEGVARRSAGGGGMLKQARGRGKAGVGVNALEGAGEETALERAAGELLLLE